MTTLTAPPPADTPPPPLSPGGRTAVRVVLVAAAAILVTGLIASLTAVAWGVSTFRVVTDTTALPTTLRSVAVDTGSVPIAVRITSDRDAREPRVDMRMVNSVRAGAQPLAVDTDGINARVTITGESSEFLRWGRAGEITLVLPADMSRRLTVTTQQKTGVVIAQADVDQLIARTGEGAVILSGSARHIEISNEHGDVMSRKPISVSESFRASTDTGDISVEFARVPSTVNTETRHGDVDLALAGAGPFLVDATTGRESGGTTVEVPLTRDPQVALAEITARSERGHVIVEDLDP